MTDTSFEMLVWRSSLPGALHIPALDDQIDIAERLRAEGLDEDLVRALYETAFLRQGFSASHLNYQAQIALQTGLWASTDCQPDDQAKKYGGTMDYALFELEQLASAVVDHLPPLIREDVPDRFDAHASATRLKGDVPAIIRETCTFLRGTPPTDRWDAANMLIARLLVIDRCTAQLDYRTFHSASLPLLASAITAANLREFILQNIDLISGPFGSAALLHATARLSHDGLGPYLCNVQRLARRSRDVFTLAHIAQARCVAHGRDTGMVPWLTLLARSLTGALLNEFIDDLGDLGSLQSAAVLAAIFDRASGWPANRIDIPLIMRLRDTALDNNDFQLAIRAQALIVRLKPDLLVERLVLGSIEATAGLVTVALQTLNKCLVLSPGNEDVLERIRDIRTGAFDQFASRYGYGSPNSRQRNRLERRNGGEVRRRRAHPVAVEL